MLYMVHLVFLSFRQSDIFPPHLLDKAINCDKILMRCDVMSIEQIATWTIITDFVRLGKWSFCVKRQEMFLMKTSIETSKDLINIFKYRLNIWLGRGYNSLTIWMVWRHIQNYFTWTKVLNGIQGKTWLPRETDHWPLEMINQKQT